MPRTPHRSAAKCEATALDSLHVWTEIKTEVSREWGIRKAQGAGDELHQPTGLTTHGWYLECGFSFSLEDSEALPPLGLYCDGSNQVALSRTCPFKRYVCFAVCQANLSHLFVLPASPRGNQVWELWLHKGYYTLTPAWVTTPQLSSLESRVTAIKGVIGLLSRICRGCPGIWIKELSLIFRNIQVRGEPTQQGARIPNPSPSYLTSLHVRILERTRQGYEN